MKTRHFGATISAVLLLAGCGQSTGDDGETSSSAPRKSDLINASSFGCIRDLEAVDRFFVGNLDGDIDATLAVARSPDGGAYPVGSIVQLVPTEAMVKRAAGFSDETNDWEFFDLDISPQGTKILTRGHKDVVNRFGNNCLECHAKAEPQWDMICQLDHGCDPIPITDAMIRGLQKTDPRCDATELTEEERQGLADLQAALAS